MDVLADVLDALTVRSSVYCRVEVGAPWALDFAPAACSTFHVVESGSCLVRIGAGGWQRLQTGDVLLLPHGAGHRMASGEAAHLCFSIDWGAAYPTVQHLQYHPEGEPTILVCGTMDFGAQNRHPLIASLPAMIHVSAVDGQMDSDFAHSTRFLYHEAQRQNPGGATVLKRLGDILFIQLMRQWVTTPDALATGYLAALRDAETGQALNLIHANPEQEWTVASLASAVALSRSAFAERFTALVGEPPLAYLTRWRMQRAARKLRETGATIEALARDSGYRSEGAFSQAFKRVYGVRPGEYRRQMQ